MPGQPFPPLTISIQGTPAPASWLLGLSEIYIHQQLGQPALCELTFHMAQEVPALLDALTPGHTLQIEIDRGEPPLFQGELTALTWEYGPARQRVLRARGYDLLHRLRQHLSPQVHVHMTVVDLARELVADLGLEVEAPFPGPLHEHLIQSHRSDLELLVHHAAQAGLYPILRENTLHLITLQGLGEPQTLTWGEDLFEARIDVNSETRHPTYRITGWRPLDVTIHEARIADGAAAPSPMPLPNAAPRHEAGSLLESDPHAEALARGQWERMTAHQQILWGVARGQPSLRPGTRVELKGDPLMPSPSGVITRATHTLDTAHGYLTQFSTEPPAPPRLPQPVATLGVVQRVDDPQGLGRVQASFPAYGDVVTAWLPVLFLAAGPKKGLVALPDVGDRVLVLFPLGDISQGVVLGGLYGMDGPPDSGVEGGRVRRYRFRTPEGREVILDDQARTLTLTDPQGNRVQLGPQGLRIHAAHDMLLEAPGHRITIRGDRIDFEKA